MQEATRSEKYRANDCGQRKDAHADRHVPYPSTRFHLEVAGFLQRDFGAAKHCRTLVDLIHNARTYDVYHQV